MFGIHWQLQLKGHHLQIVYAVRRNGQPCSAFTTRIRYIYLVNATLHRLASPNFPQPNTAAGRQKSKPVLKGRRHAKNARLAASQFERILNKGGTNNVRSTSNGLLRVVSCVWYPCTSQTPYVTALCCTSRSTRRRVHAAECGASAVFQYVRHPVVCLSLLLPCWGSCGLLVLSSPPASCARDARLNTTSQLSRPPPGAAASGLYRQSPAAANGCLPPHGRGAAAVSLC